MNTYTTAQHYAVKIIRKHGMEILERNIDERIDLVAWDRKADEIVFVEINEHKTPPKAGRRNWKMLMLYQQRKAIRRWLRVNKWRGKHRFDVLEIYGTEKPVIDHIQNVNLKK